MYSGVILGCTQSHISECAGTQLQNRDALFFQSKYQPIMLQSLEHDRGWNMIWKLIDYYPVDTISPVMVINYSNDKLIKPLLSSFSPQLNKVRYLVTDMSVVLLSP